MPRDNFNLTALADRIQTLILWDNGDITAYNSKDDAILYAEGQVAADILNLLKSSKTPIRWGTATQWKSEAPNEQIQGETNLRLGNPSNS